MDDSQDSPLPDIDGLKGNLPSAQIKLFANSRKNGARSNWRQVTPTIYDRLDPVERSRQQSTAGGFQSNPIKVFN